MRRPWFSNHAGIAGMPQGMLQPDEGSMLYHLAKDLFRGHGDIIDAGAFLGSSAYCLAKGLEDNAAVMRKAERIHSYDLFQVWHEPGGTDREMAEGLRNQFGIEVEGYESTVGIFAKNLGPLARYITVHQGDILKQHWSGRPIEILFVDICKIQSIWQHILGVFFRSLIPGVSVVIHQDWHHPSLPYLHVGQEALADYFEVVEPKANDSAVFRLVDRIPDRVLDSVARFDFSDAEKLSLMDRAIHRFSGQARFLKLAKAALLLDMNRRDEASEIVHHNVFNHGETVTPPEQQYFQTFAGYLAQRIEKEGLVPPAGFDEPAYLASRPAVRSLIEAGHFSSGLHYWYRHGRWEENAGA